ncbi:C17orf62 isoform 41, partial [Pan troglodytes]
KGYMVVLRLATGFSHPLTQSAVMGHRSRRSRQPWTPAVGHSKTSGEWRGGARPGPCGC